MKRKSVIIIAACILISAVLFLTAFTEKKPKILIIGDSISIGYTPFVKKYFSDQAVILHNPGNAQHTGTGLEKIREWVGTEDWDIIQFNWGLWDLCYRDPESKNLGNRDKINGKITYSVTDYEANLDSLVTILKEISDAKLIFVTTTCVPENEAGRFTEDVVKYNKAAKRVMKKHGIPVNDIYKASIPTHKTSGLGDDNVHYTDEGYEKLGKLISDYLSKRLK
ncbi:MAG: SGNH/GDSL hydrolase family protein [Paludibacter sp.]|nr:SGNH/GDSL hydrolase family protein [Paludibacter sp.]